MNGNVNLTNGWASHQFHAEVSQKLFSSIAVKLQTSRWRTLLPLSCSLAYTEKIYWGSFIIIWILFHFNKHENAIWLIHWFKFPFYPGLPVGHGGKTILAHIHIYGIFRMMDYLWIRITLLIPERNSHVLARLLSVWGHVTHMNDVMHLIYVQKIRQCAEYRERASGK